MVIVFTRQGDSTINKHFLQFVIVEKEPNRGVIFRKGIPISIFEREANFDGIILIKLNYFRQWHKTLQNRFNPIYFFFVVSPFAFVFHCLQQFK